MAQEIVEGINPTRMELLSIRKRRMLAEKGHKLLGEKRDALIVQFFDVLKKREELKGDVVESFKKAGLSLDEAMATMGYDGVDALAKGMPQLPHPKVTTLNIMGVKVPVINSSVRSDEKLPWSLGTTPQSLDDSASGYRIALDKLLRLAEAEGSMERLAIEIEKTKRRVNALEHIFIPKFRNTERYINMQLQEREREDFVRRKRIKAMMEKRDLEKLSQKDR